MKYKKSRIVILVIASVIAVLLLLLLLGKLFVLIFFAEPTVIQSVESPDGMYTAYVFESNGGATTGFIYHLSILETGKKLGKGNGNTCTSGYYFDVEWINDRELQVNNISEAKTFRKKRGCERR